MRELLGFLHSQKELGMNWMDTLVIMTIMETGYMLLRSVLT